MSILDPIKKREYHKTYRNLNKDRIALSSKEYHLKRKYGITLDQYNDLLKAQDYRCAICNKHKDEFKRGYSLAVDHDHKTMEIFGLLCYTCNHRLVGRFRNPEIFQSVAKYLEKGTGWMVPLKKKRKRKRRVRRN